MRRARSSPGDPCRRPTDGRSRDAPNDGGPAPRHGVGEPELLLGAIGDDVGTVITLSIVRSTAARSHHLVEDASLRVRRRGHAEQRGDRWCHIHEFRLAWPPAAEPGPGQQQWDLDLFYAAMPAAYLPGREAAPSEGPGRLRLGHHASLPPACV